MEKRRVERYEMHIPATVFVEGRHQEVLTLETENVSSKGTYLHTDRLVPQGVNVQVELRVPAANLLKLLGADGQVKVTVNGTVVRAEPGGIAIQFDGRYEITSLLERLAGQRT